MKKIFFLFSAFLISAVSMAQINFQFRFMNAASTVLTTTGVMTSATPMNVFYVDLSSSVCEGEFIKIANLTAGSYGGATISHSTLWSSAWGWVRQTPLVPATLSWAGSYYDFAGQQQWDKPSGASWVPQDFHLPIGQAGNSQVCYTYDATTVTYCLVASPVIGYGYNNVDLSTSPLAHQNTGCANAIAFRIKVKRAPAPIADQTICPGAPVTITIPAGVTATGWTPNNPTITSPMVTTNYSVTLTNGACTYVDNFTINVLGTLFDPKITGNSTYCSAAGQPSFYGFDNTYQAEEGQWEIIECNSSGTAIGSTLYNTGLDGNYIYNNFTFPVTLTCGKYYKVKYTVSGYTESCPLTRFIEKVIYFACSPSANGGPDVTICKGNCFDFTGRTAAGLTYSWTGPSGVISTSSTIHACPVSSTTYTYTITNAAGCVASDNVVVTVVDNDPMFSLGDSTLNPTYYTLAARPNITNISGIPGMSYAWFVEELDPATDAQLFFLSNPSNWWDFPTVTINTFKCFDHTATAYTGTVSLSPGCTTPALGKFLYNHKYRITRGTWSTDCGWQQVSKYSYTLKSMHTGKDTVIIEDAMSAPDMSYLVTSVLPVTSEATNISVYPNPATGAFTIEMSTATKASIEIYDALGKKIKQLEQNGLKSVIDLTGFPKGIYMINVISNGAKTSKKIILE